MKTMHLFLSLFLGLLVLSACTEDRQLETLLKPEEQIMSKKDIDTESHYLYVPLGQESSRTSLHGRAYEVGQAKVVKMRVTEFSLDVVSIEKESRFADNPNNQKLLISVPIEHVDYRCQDDPYGECIGQEVENERIPWDQKNFIRPDFSEATIIDTNFFAYEFAGPRQCYQEEQKELLARTLTPDSLNFTIKRSFKDQLYFFCIRDHDLSDFTNLNWTETTSYSLVKLDTVASPAYKKAEYHPDWINTFGFFETDNYQLDVDGNATQSGEVKYMQRWNPERADIVYHLSQSFAKPENAVLKAATVESFSRINLGLKQAGAKFQLKLQDPDPTIDPGDLRNSMIILVDDPVASSVIGYGPSVANPLTGEVVSARTVMYSGSIRKFVRFTYDDIVRKAQETVAAETQAQSGNPLPGLSQEAILEQLESQTFNLLNFDRTQVRSFANLDDLNIMPVTSEIDRTPNLSESDLQEYIASQSKRDFVAVLAEQNKYPSEALTFGDINQDMVQEMIAKIGDLQPWESLSAKKKQDVLDVLTPYVWVPTLVHEIGHNLGLRHNFSGSEDGDHFYSQEELKALDLPVSSEGIPYSSVMDYPKSEINALRTLGKYDIAALQFGYGNQVRMDDGSLAQADSTEAPQEGLENFDYCSDEGVRPNPTCNPFDEGIGLKAITESLIDSYHDRYQRSNFRRGRANFSGMDDDSYLRSLNRTFRTLRLVYERYESLIKRFDLDQEQIDEIPFLKEIDESVVIAADFLMGVVATPDTLCVVQNVETGVLQIVPMGIFSDLSHDGTGSCQGLSLNAAFVVVAEGGKALNSLKYPDNPNRFADQIDRRGTWLNKAMAMKTLFRRTLGSTLFDKYNGNFVDHPKAGPRVLGFLRDMMTNQLRAPVDFRFDDGDVVSVPVTLDLDDAFYEVPASELPLPHRMLDLPYDNMHLPEILTQIMVTGINEGSDSGIGDLLKSALSVHRTPQDLSTGDYVSTTSRGQALYARADSFIAGPLIIQANRADFFEGLNLSRASLTKVLDLLENPPKADNGDEEEIVLVEDPTEELEPAEKLAYERGAVEIKAYLDNPTSATYLKRILLNL